MDYTEKLIEAKKKLKLAKNEFDTLLFFSNYEDLFIEDGNYYKIHPDYYDEALKNKLRYSLNSDWLKTLPDGIVFEL